MGALQQLLSNLDNQRAVWSQIWAFRWGGSRGQREEGDANQNPKRVTEAEGGGYLGPAAGPDQKPGAVTVAATSDPSVAPLHLGKAERGSTGTRRVASAASETRPPHQGCRWEPPQEGLSLEGVETCGEGPSRAEERGSQRQGRRELLHRCGWRQSPGEKGSRRIHLWWRSRRARG